MELEGKIFKKELGNWLMLMLPIYGILLKIVCCKLVMKYVKRKNHGDAWWWNEEVKEAIQQKKVAYEKMCKNQSEENKAKYENIKNQTNKVAANSMRKEAEKELTKLNKKPNNIFTLVKFIKKDGKDIEGGRCMIGKDGRLGFNEKGKEYGKIKWRRL